MTQPDVSVIIPAYNRAATVAAAIGSVLSQDGVNFEVIVVDDASEDGTAAVVEGIGDARVRLVRHARNAGAGAARNTGIAAARAGLVAFQDSDDLWLPGKLARQVAALRASPDAVAVYCGMLIENAEAVGGSGSVYLPDPAQRPRSGALHGALLAANFVSTQTLVVHRAALERAGQFDTALPALEDWDFALRLAALGPIALVDDVLVRQRFSDNSLTRSLEKRLRAQEMILERHAQALAGQPGVLALHHRRIAGAHRRLGDVTAARRHIAAALGARPLSPRLWALWLRLRLIPGG